MPYHWGPRMTKLIFAWTTIVMSQKKIILYEWLKDKSIYKCIHIYFTHIQTGQAIPAKDMFASFAHHLSTTIVLFNGHRTHWAALYQIIIERNANISILSIGSQPSCIHLTWHIRMPLHNLIVIFKMYCYFYEHILLTVFLQLEQNSSRQVGHKTEQGCWTDAVCVAAFPLYMAVLDGVVDRIAVVSVGDVDESIGCTAADIEQTVSQPARGHHVRFLSNSTSVS